MMTMSNLHSATWVILYDGPEGIVIKDMCVGKSVTNDAENVVSTLVQRLGKRRLFYFDTENFLDELVVCDGHFDSFKIGAPESVRIALHQEGLL